MFRNSGQPGESVPYPITVAADAPGTYTNEVTWMTAGVPRATASATHTVLDEVSRPELLVTITGPHTVARGQEHTYGVRVRNIGTGEAEGVQVLGRSEPPKRISFEEVSRPEAEHTDFAFRWAVGTLAGTEVGGTEVTSVGAHPAEVSNNASTTSLPRVLGSIAYSVSMTDDGI